MKKIKTLQDLTKKQVKTLRSQVVLNSLYYSDYSNDFISEHDAINMFDAYLEDLTIQHEDDYEKMDLFDFIEKYDTTEALYDYIKYNEFTSDIILLNQ